MRALTRVVAAALLLTTLLWFSSRLNVLPTRQAILQHVLLVTESTKSPADVADESLPTYTVIPNSPLQSHDTSTTAAAVADPVLASTTSLAAKPTISAKTKNPFVAVLEEVSESLNAVESPNAHTGTAGDKVVVVGRLQSEDTDWLVEELTEYVS